MINLKVAKAVSAAIAAMLPWQHKATSLNLVSDYYQPTIGVIASLGALIFFVMAVIGDNGISQERLRFRLLVSIFLFIISALVCFFLTISVDKYFTFGACIYVCTFFWWVFYVLTFTSLANAIGHVVKLIRYFGSE